MLLGKLGGVDETEDREPKGRLCYTLTHAPATVAELTDYVRVAGSVADPKLFFSDPVFFGSGSRLRSKLPKIIINFISCIPGRYR
jgi:hypothetical protein